MNKKTAIISSLIGATFLGITSVATVSIMNELKSTNSDAKNDLVLAASSPMALANDLGSLPRLPQISDLPISQNLSTVTSGTGTGATSISPTTAEQLVLAATKGKLVYSKQVLVQGIPAYAVTVERSDKSVITGFVDLASGTIFNWDVVRNGVFTTDYNDDEDDDKYDDKDDDEHDDESEHDDDDD